MTIFGSPDSIFIYKYFKKYCSDRGKWVRKLHCQQVLTSPVNASALADREVVEIWVVRVFRLDKQESEYKKMWSKGEKKRPVSAVLCTVIKLIILFDGCLVANCLVSDCNTAMWSSTENKAISMIWCTL